MKALNYQGGSNAKNGAAKILLRAAVAALLNAAHPAVDYPLTEQQVISQVNTSLATNNRNSMLLLAMRLDTYNNLGGGVCSDKTRTPTALSAVSSNSDPLGAAALPSTGGLTSDGISNIHWLSLAFALIAISSTVVAYCHGTIDRRLDTTG